VTTYQYSVEVQNEYLGKFRRVTGRSRREVQIKAAEQIQRWNEQEARARLRAVNADAKESATLATERAQALVEEYGSLLAATLSVDDRLDWRGLMDLRPFQVPQPRLEHSQAHVGVPAERPFAEAFSKKVKERREKAEAEADSHHRRAVASWQSQRDRFEQDREKNNESVQRFRRDYERGVVEAIEQYVSLVLAASSLPDGITREVVVKYVPAERALLIEATLPTLSDMPTVTEYRYISTRRVTEEKAMKEKDRANLYDQVITQLALRTMHEIFEGDYARHCDSLTLNGVISDIDAATGRDYSASILSVQASRDEFLAIDLSRVDPAACFRMLKGVSGARFANMQPIRPLRVLNLEDERFINADEVLSELELDQNLMTMPWQDFEILVRDLFESMFGTKGAQVKVTRTSRDEGVDAVVFDPDPLMGGKTVIQAKRYKKLVPVAAVRELYGTMLSEGAGKGIIVTTSHYGKGARDFVKDKPLTLVDGPHLLHLMQNSGHRVRIDLTEPDA
jgi:restriction system protein